MTNLTVTDPNNDGDLWIECSCGACGYLSRLRGGLTHRRTCKTREQYSATSTTDATLAPVSSSAPAVNLRTFGASVRRTGLTLGRDADVLEAVRDGHLSVSDAMNTDD